MPAGKYLGENNPLWKGGREIDAQGYVRLAIYPGDPFWDMGGANRDNRRIVFEHRYVMATLLGRTLHPWENVHHKNGCRSDNRPENLELWISKQPPGQRVEDQLGWAREILRLYG